MASTVLFAETVFDQAYPDESLAYITALLHKPGAADWSDQELAVVANAPTHFTAGVARLSLAHGAASCVDFNSLPTPG